MASESEWVQISVLFCGYVEKSESEKVLAGRISPKNPGEVGEANIEAYLQFEIFVSASARV